MQVFCFHAPNTQCVELFWHTEKILKSYILVFISKKCQRQSLTWATEVKGMRFKMTKKI